MNRTKKISLLSFLLVGAMLAVLLSAILPMDIFAADYDYGNDVIELDITKGDITLSGNSGGYLVGGKFVASFTTTNPIIRIKGNGQKTDRKIHIGTKDTYNYTIILDNVVIDTSNRTDGKYAAFRIDEGKSTDICITVILADGTNNSLTSAEGCAGLLKGGSTDGSWHNGSSHQLKITCEAAYHNVSDHSCSKESGCGSLTAKGGNSTSTGFNCGAGIGSNGNDNGYRNIANLEIAGGVIQAIGGYSESITSGGAGIGTGSAKSGSATGSTCDIVITGGHVTAVRGSYSAACIGGGYRSGEATVTITGGTVIATDSHPDFLHESDKDNELNQLYGPRGAGIGGGGGGQGSGAVAGATVKISGGNITAASGCGAAIGSGAGGNGQVLFYSNGVLTGGADGNGQPATVEITGGVIHATTTSVGAAIGAGGSTVNISTGGDADVNPYLVGKGGDATVTISGSPTITARSEYGADIGGGGTLSHIETGSGGKGTVSISGSGNITANSGGIGGGRANTGDGGDAEITITGGTINAASIGGGNATSGDGGSVTNLSVTGGNLNLTGNIGGGTSVDGNGGDVETFTIENVTVYAGAVGGGNSTNGNGGSIGTLTVKDGTLKLNGGVENGPILDGIGGGTSVEGNGGNVGTIQIQNGTIEATFIGGGNTVNGTAGSIGGVDENNNPTGGIHVLGGSTLTVTGSIGGGNATGTGSAGSVTKIEITNSTITADSIGGGTSVDQAGGSINEIIIDNGKLTVNGSIGGGDSQNGDGGTIGTITVRNQSELTVGGDLGAGNSENGDGGDVTSITVTDSKLTVNGMIGGGNTVNGTAGSIGGVDENNNPTGGIYVLGGSTLTVTGSIGGGNATGTGSAGSVTKIEITNSTITAGSIGGGASVDQAGGSINEIIIDNGKLTVNGSIGGGDSENGDGGTIGTITVQNQSDLTVAGDLGAGNSKNGNGGDVTSITVTGSKLTVNGSIGGGISTEQGNGGNVTSISINNSQVSAGSIGGGSAKNGNGGSIGTIKDDGSTEGGITIENGQLVIKNDKNIYGSIGGGESSVSGVGGSAVITVKGETSSVEAASIGGGFSNDNIGGKAHITIHNGTLIADTIGGGDTVSGTGGEAILIVHTGTLDAQSIGGGNAIGTGDGGRATITVNGGHFTVAEGIGGGTSVGGYGGYCTAIFTGGTIRTYSIGGGLSQTHGYSQPNSRTNATITITGGTLNAMMTVQPTNGDGVNVFSTATTLYFKDERIEGNQGVASITVKIGDTTYAYGLMDVILDDSAMLYFWFPKTATLSDAIIENDTTKYEGTINGSKSGVLKDADGSTKNYFSVHFPFDDRYTISYDAEGNHPIKGIWAAAMGEALSFYVHPKEYAPGLYYTIVAYRSDDEQYIMDIFEADRSSRKECYYFKMTITSDTEIVIAASDGTSNRVSLDLSQNSVVLNQTTAAIGGYSLNLSGITDFLLTSGGLPTENMLRVESGIHKLHIHWMNANNAKSVITVNGGKVTLTASETDNRIVSAGASSIYVADGAYLYILLDGADSLTLGTETTDKPVIDGQGTVDIQRTGGFGFLSLDQPQGNSEAQIVGKQFAYQGQLETTEDGKKKVPYTIKLLEGALAGWNYYDGTSDKVTNTPSDENTKYIAFTVTYKLPDGLSSEDVSGVATSDGTGYQVTFTNTDGVAYYVAAIYHFGQRTDYIEKDILPADKCMGDLYVFVVKAEGITFVVDNVTYVYTGTEQKYPEIIVVPGSGVMEDSIIVTYGLSADALSVTRPGGLNVGTYTIHYKIEYKLSNNTDAEPITGEAQLIIVPGVNEWTLELICGTIIKGETPDPNAIAKWGTVVYEYRSYLYDETTKEWYWTDWTQTIPTDAGIYEVRAYVSADTSGYQNYDRLDSDAIQFVIDRAAVFYTLGKEYTSGYEGYVNGTVELDKNKVFTLYYGYYYTPKRDTTPLTFVFVDKDGNALPTGTVITLLSFESDGLKAYYYVLNGEETAVPSIKFISMGESAATNGFESDVIKPVEAILKLCIELPKDYEKSFTIHLKQTDASNDYIAPDLEVENKKFDPTTLTVTENSNIENGMLSADVVVENIEGKNHVLVVELIDTANGNAILLPGGAVVTVDGKPHVGIGGTKVFFSDIAAGTHTVMVDMKTHCLGTSKTYQLKLTLCESPLQAVYSMADAVADQTSGELTAKEYTAPGIAVNVTDRYVEKHKGETGVTITVTGTGDVPNGTKLTCKVYQVVQDADGSRTAEETAVIPNTFESGVPIELDLTDVNEGTYLFLFSYGTATYRYTIIVSE